MAETGNRDASLFQGPEAGIRPEGRRAGGLPESAPVLDHGEIPGHEMEEFYQARL